MMSRLFMTLGLLLLCSGLHALGNVHESRMTPSQALEFLARASEISRALDERTYAVETNTVLEYYARCGNPGGFIQKMKTGIRSVVPKYVDRSRESAGSFNDWFSLAVTNRRGQVSYNALFPAWNVTNLEATVGLPGDALFVSPETGKQLLQSEDYGMSVCSDALQELKYLSLSSFVQTNQGHHYSVNTTEHYNVTWQDEGRCYTNGCDSLNDTLYDGQPLTFTGCSVPDATPVASGYTGRAVWEVSLDADYTLEDRTNAEDYMGSASYWDKTRTRNEQIDVEYNRQIVTSIAICSTNVKSELKGSLMSYGRFAFATTLGFIVDSIERTGCIDRMCDELDDDANVIGHYKCGIEFESTTKQYEVAGWDPGLSKAYGLIASVGQKTPDSTSARLAIPVPDDLFSNTTATKTRNEGYSCNAVTDPMYFGLWYYGVLGYQLDAESCRSTIPARRLEYEVGPVLLEAHFDYCP